MIQIIIDLYLLFQLSQKFLKKSSLTNFMPISMTTTCCLSVNLDFDSYSTFTALLEATNDWCVNVDNGLLNGVVFIDLKKAFDTIDHGIL